MPPKKKKKLVRFRTRLQDERRRQNRFARVTLGFEISRERQGLLLQSRKMAKKWQSSWKTIETTAESSLTSFLASGASFFGREAVSRATKSREVPRHIKSDEGLFWKSIVAGEKLQEKLQEAVCCQFFQGSVELLENVSSKIGLGSTCLARCENENCPSQIGNDAF